MGWGAPAAVIVSNVEVIAIFGPTASGKSAVAHALADQLGTEVVSADALQVYRGLPVVTNQPETPTRLVAIRGLGEEMTVGEYSDLAHAAIDELVERNGVAVVSGGTGLYLRAALVDLEIPPAPAAGARDRWERVYDESPAAAHAQLADLDPSTASAVHPNDRRRVVRALELAEAGSSLSREVDRLWSDQMRRPTLVVGLDVPPEQLATRIRDRAEEMMREGAVDEARVAIEQPISRTAAAALGLRELATLEPAEALDRLIAQTVRYAAYQRKWMRRIPGIVMIDGDRSVGEVVDAILEVARAR